MAAPPGWLDAADDLQQVDERDSLIVSNESATVTLDAP